MMAQSYYVRERGVVAGPFDLAQLKAMRRANQLARFHMVSPDGRSWVKAESLTDVFHPAPDAPASVAEVPAETAPIVSEWYYSAGRQIHGPIDAQALQGLIDRGEVGPKDLVRPDHAAEWSPCDQAGAFRFVTPALAIRRRRDAAARKVGLVVGV